MFIIRIFKFIDRIIAEIFILAIKFYQKTLSPDHSWMRHFHEFGFCRYSPSCSQYGIDALKKYGAVRGLVMTLWRILRCNPWSKGGFDPVK